MALTVVIIVIIMLALLAGYVTQLGYNQRRLAESASGKRAKIYFRAQAGLVHAQWRIRTNNTTGLTPVGSFATAAWDPNPYQIDVDGDGTNDCTVDIEEVGANGLRAISSTGLDN